MFKMLYTIIFTIVALFFVISFSFADDNAEVISEYRIGSGDTIQISVYKYDEFNSTTQVGPDGIVSLPLIGDIVAAGSTRKQLKEELTSRLSKFIKEGAEVTVSVVQFNSQKISIFGQVSNQRTFSFSIIPSLLEIIIQSIPTPSADLTAIKIIPADPSIGKPIVVDITSALQSGDLSKLPKLHSGDTIYVPKIEEKPVATSPTQTQVTQTQVTQTQVPPVAEKEEQKIIINVMGAVANTNSYVFTEEPTLPQVLMRAGGTTDYMMLKDVRVIRSDATSGDRVLHVDMDKYLTEGDSSILPKLYSGDIVYIPIMTSEKMKDFSIVITGEVVKPGSFGIREPMNILDVISMVGGLTPNADPEMIRIRRESEDFYQEKIVNIDEYLRDTTGSNIPSEMVGPGYRIYVPTKQRNPATIAARATRGLVVFLADLIPIYSLYRIIR